ncbi:hypothetical protein Tco_0044746 [Tanacetum coccineum]
MLPFRCDLILGVLQSSSPPQIPFTLSPPSPVLTAPPPSPIRSLGYRAATIRMRAEAATTSHSLPLPPPFILSPIRPDALPPMPTSAPTSLPPLLLPSASHREDRPEVNLPPRKRLGIALGPGYEVGESSAAAAARLAGGLRADYGFGAPVSTDTKLGAHVRDFESMVRRDTDENYTKLDDSKCQDREFTVKSDRSRHRAISDLLETNRRRCEEMRELRAADCARQQQIIQTLTVMQTLQRDDSTSRTRHHTAGAGDSLTGTGDGITRISYCITGTVGTPLGSCTARAARGGWCHCQCLAATDATMNGVDKPYFGTVSGDPNSVARDCICNDLVDLRKKMTDKYCPRNEMKKLEAEYCWNMKVKVILMWSSTKPTFPRISTAGCGFRMYPEETYKIERYVGGLPDMIHGNIVASKPKTMQEAVEMATELMDKEVMYLLLKDKLKTKNFENTSRNIRLQHRIRGKTPAWQTILLDRG